VSRLDEALERLERAVARLEAGCSRVGEGGAVRCMGEAEAETLRLRMAAGEIAVRVDGALARVDRALGGGG
jgi:hypothetical protein